MSYVLTLFLVLFLTNSRELTPIHIWVIEFVIFCDYRLHHRYLKEK